MSTNINQTDRKISMQKNVQDLRRKYNLSQEDIASRLGVTMMTVYRWENGIHLPRSRFIIREFEKFKQELEKK